MGQITTLFRMKTAPDDFINSREGLCRKRRHLPTYEVFRTKLDEISSSIFWKSESIIVKKLTVIEGNNAIKVVLEMGA